MVALAQAQRLGHRLRFGFGFRRKIEGERILRGAAEAGVAGAVQEGDDLLELGDGEVGEVSGGVGGREAVGIGAGTGIGIRTGTGTVRSSEEGDEMLHALQPSSGRFLDGPLVVVHRHLHAVHRHETRSARAGCEAQAPEVWREEEEEEEGRVKRRRRSGVEKESGGYKRKGKVGRWKEGEEENPKLFITRGQRGGRRQNHTGRELVGEELYCIKGRLSFES